MVLTEHGPKFIAALEDQLTGLRSLGHKLHYTKGFAEALFTEALVSPV